MKRDSAYYRRMRAKHIRRKKRIATAVCRHWWYPHDGMYSKNKVHCSCRMCRGKDYFGRHILTRQEQKSYDDIPDQLEYYELAHWDAEEFEDWNIEL